VTRSCSSPLFAEKGTKYMYLRYVPCLIERKNMEAKSQTQLPATSVSTNSYFMRSSCRVPTYSVNCRDIGSPCLFVLSQHPLIQYLLILLRLTKLILWLPRLHLHHFTQLPGSFTLAYWTVAGALAYRLNVIISEQHSGPVNMAE